MREPRKPPSQIVEMRDVLTRYALNLLPLPDGPVMYQEPVFVGKPEGDLPCDYDSYADYMMDGVSIKIGAAREEIIKALWAMGGLRLRDGSLDVTPFADAIHCGQHGWTASLVWTQGSE
jgi:hypothetical protein